MVPVGDGIKWVIWDEPTIISVGSGAAFTPEEVNRVVQMLLVHQAGSVKVGELVRYTVTYTPSHDRILPTPEHLHVKIKNTCAIPLRAAWIHGPYALHVSTYPSTFNPHHKVEQPQKDGIPQYESMLKAGGSWLATLKVPEDIRETGADLGRPRTASSTQHDSDEPPRKSATWIIEITSQILFSNSASVEFEVLIGRDERSLDLGFAAVAGHGHGGPGRVQDLHANHAHSAKRRNRQTAGVYSKAIQLVVEDTETLWNKPALPTWEHDDKPQQDDAIGDSNFTQKKKNSRKQKKIHLVVLTHGLHSNTGADMLFLKESIDATVKEAREETKRRKSSYRDDKVPPMQNTNGDNTEKGASTAPLTGGQEDLDPDDDDEEQTIVRGFTGNTIKTENGIQYLGKRLAKYILKMTYPDQPFVPVKKSFARSFTDSFRSQAQKSDRDGAPAHLGSSVHLQEDKQEEIEDRAYKFTSISFIGHSLGGLIQTYAIAYIQKHSPTFFDVIEPVNFVTMAAPMLGLSNENPMYVKFALDFGLVGRTGQDLGLTWRPPHLAKGGWNALLAGLSAGSNHKEEKQEDPTAKPLLRILPTGPAHHVLRKFRNRTLYSNVVNDGIVPLRTSCLLFLDWRGLGKVEKARRENGLIGTMAEWGWAELTGANQSTIAPNVISERYSMEREDDEDDNQHVRDGEGDKVPQPGEDETTEDNKKLTQRLSFNAEDARGQPSIAPNEKEPEKGMLDTFLGFLGVSPGTSHNASPRSQSPQSRSSRKQIKALRRAQTVKPGEDELPEDIALGMEGTTDNPTMRPHLHQHHTGQTSKRPAASKGTSYTDDEVDMLQAPPKTSIFESAGDILHPPLPSTQWITDPSARARTIFHDRVYHPDDIPPPPVRKHSSRLMRSISGDNVNRQNQDGTPQGGDSGGMKIEEKIARAYHRDLSWRKVLVRLEPDAHNNMIVRRMFANAYGWPVIKHVCDTHFANTWAAQTRDEDEPARERALPADAAVDPSRGEEVQGQTEKKPQDIQQDEMRTAEPELPDLKHCPSNDNMRRPGHIDRTGSVEWSDTYLEGSDDDNSDVDERGFVQRLINPHMKKVHKPTSTPHEVSRPTAAYTDGHRGLAPSSPTSTRSQVVPASPPVAGLTGSQESPLRTSGEHKAAIPQSVLRTTEVGLRKSLESHVSQDQNLVVDEPVTIKKPDV
ncbi:hypothetical protein AMS68_001237 [Peltaster fructicola]|uniref:DUF676 domain-containing protein n=1 Tax=Peltaster fructicola TaxID=286661 RepID=A0A6H0XMK0_9PEZI|nr:hypothetical protein AMS68_001237 [Peltaster fructicola]